jgi:hypothetical protein
MDLIIFKGYNKGAPSSLEVACRFNLQLFKVSLGISDLVGSSLNCFISFSLVFINITLQIHFLLFELSVKHVNLIFFYNVKVLLHFLFLLITGSCYPIQVFSILNFQLTELCKISLLGYG